jgi:hypothetical protein
MFPNLRLMIVATMASILGISCGLGVFAAFHVNRDPILLSPSGAPPLLFSNAGPMAPNEPGVKTAEPFDTHFTISLPPAPVAPPERPLRSSALAPDPTPSQVDSVMARPAEPPESANPEATADIASTEETKAESTTTDAARIEVTKAESTTADAASTEIAKAEANTELIKAEETKPDDASKLSLGDSNTVAPAIGSILETSAGEQSPPSSVDQEKTVRPASTKIRAKTVKGKAPAKTKSAKVRAKAARTRVTHTKPLRSRPSAVVQFADQTFAAQPMYQWPTQPTKPITIRRGRHGSSRTR